MERTVDLNGTVAPWHGRRLAWLNRLHVPKSTLLSGRRDHEQPVNVFDS